MGHYRGHYTIKSTPEKCAARRRQLQNLDERHLAVRRAAREHDNMARMTRNQAQAEAIYQQNLVGPHGIRSRLIQLSPTKWYLYVVPERRQEVQQILKEDS